MSKFTNILATAFIAGAAGAIAGILLAPETGKRTRKKLRRRARRINDNLDEMTYAGKEIFKDVKSSIDEALYTAGNTFEKLRRN